MDAIILAGTSEKDVKEFGMNKSLVKFNGLSLVTIISRALRQVKKIDRIFVITDIDKASIYDFTDSIDKIVKPSGGIMDSLVQCIKTNGITGSFICAASDMPFVSTEAVEDFISKCNSSDHLNYSIVAKASFKKLYSDYKKTFFRLRDGIFTSGNIFMAETEATTKMIEFAKTYFDNRKSPLKLASLIGVGGLIKFICGRLSSSQIQNIFQLHIGYSLNIVKSEYPQIALDIDRLDQLQLLEKQ